MLHDCIAWWNSSFICLKIKKLLINILKHTMYYKNETGYVSSTCDIDIDRDASLFKVSPF